MSTVGVIPFIKKIDTPSIGKVVHEPNILFFSGGTALSPLASCLKKYTKNAVYLITPFDSGGSSAVLRKAFSMPAVGDLRARLVALADSSQSEYRTKIQLFDYRLPDSRCSKDLLAELMQFADGTHRFALQLSDLLLQSIKDNIQFFLSQLPKDVDLSGASIGNILLTAKYLQEGRDLFAAVSFFSQWLGVRGVVRPLIDANVHLCVELKNGEKCIGQHCFTGKSFKPISSPIQRIWFTNTLESTDSIKLRVYNETCQYINKADLICFPMGSFFSSIIANILPDGISESICKASCPKVFIPNKNIDPELLGYSVQDQIEYLAYIVGRSVNKQIYPDIVVLDTEVQSYPGGETLLSWLGQKDIQVVMSNLARDQYCSSFDPEILCQTILGLLY